MINEDFNDFVSLSTKLVDVDSALSRMEAPLLELQARTGGRGRGCVQGAAGCWLSAWCQKMTCRSKECSSSTTP